MNGDPGSGSVPPGWGSPGAAPGPPAGSGAGSGPAGWGSGGPPLPPRQARRYGLTAVLTAILLILIGVWVYRQREREGAASEEPPSGQAVIVDEEEPLAEPGKSAEREAVIFFSREGAEGLYPERRRIYVTSSVPDMARQVLEELVRGPRRALGVPVLPREAELRQVYIDREGNAYVDFSAELARRHPGGSDAEIATLFAIVNSLTYNFPEIRAVRILIEGEERETLAGHLDLTRRYYRDLSRVAPEALEGLQGESEPIASR